VSHTQVARADISTNRLYITLQGSYSIEESWSNVETILRELKKLKSGFVVITDISKLQVATPEVSDHIATVQSELENAGVGKVIRIVSEDSMVTKMQYRRVHRKVGASYDTVEVTSLEEAESLA
jgi:predicted transcriptional regulator